MKKRKSKLSNILDSSLISATFFDKNLYLSKENIKQKGIYSIKVVSCGNYIQVYKYDKVQKLNKVYDVNDLELKKRLEKTNINDIDDKKEEKESSLNEIEYRNIIRSKLECQRLAKCNANEWKTFITLTFKDNISDLNYSYEQLRKFFFKVQRIFKNFKYLCIPEFQKRGAIHYHLLTNIPIDSAIIPKRNKLRLWNKEIKQYKELEYYDIKYWNEGFSSAEPLENDIKKIVGYISKYMTKDIDNRLFSHRRYYSSHNLNTPIVSYIDISNKKNLAFLNTILKDKTLIYENRYDNILDNSNVIFKEYLK